MADYPFTSSLDGEQVFGTLSRRSAQVFVPVAVGLPRPIRNEAGWITAGMEYTIIDNGGDVIATAFTAELAEKIARLINTDAGFAHA